MPITELFLIDNDMLTCNKPELKECKDALSKVIPACLYAIDTLPASQLSLKFMAVQKHSIISLFNQEELHVPRPVRQSVVFYYCPNTQYVLCHFNTRTFNFTYL